MATSPEPRSVRRVPMLAERRRRASRVPRIVTTGIGLALVATTGAACSGAEGSPGAATAPAPTIATSVGTPAGAGTDSSRAVSGCGPARPDRASNEPRTLTYDGRERRYLLSTPTGHDGSHGVPLIVSLHGSGANMERQEAASALGTKGPARGFVVVTPDALDDAPHEWNIFRLPGRADDYGFIDSLIGRLTDDLCIDPARVYATGISNGSAFSGFLGCTAPFHFAAIALVAATVPANCPAGVHPSVIAFHGTADPIVPYLGRTDGGVPVPAAETAMQARAQQAGCRETPVEEGVDATRSGGEPAAERLTYPGCPAGTELVLYRLEGVGHRWPGSTDAAEPAAAVLGMAGTLPATDLILDFFAARGTTMDGLVRRDRSVGGPPG